MMIRYLIALALLATPATAQVITAPSRLPDGGDGVVTLVKAGATLTPPQVKGTRIVLCPDLPKWSYVKEGAACPAPPRPMVDMAKANKAGAIKWTACSGARIVNAYRIIGAASGVTTGTCDGLVGMNLGRVGVEIRGDNAVLSNFRLEHGPVQNVSPDLPEGVQVKIGKRVTIRNGYVSGFAMAPIPGKYRNGDGYVVETGTEDIRFENVESVDSGDSSFDWLKGTRITGDNMVGSNSNRCLKVGALDAHIGKLRCSRMRNEAIVTYATASTPVIEEFTYDWTGQTKPITLIVTAAKGARLEIRKCIFIGTPPAGSKMTSAKGLNLDASCVVK